MLFRIEDLVVHYNKVAALKGIGLELGAGDIVTLIGANGAGKSTALRAVSGLVKPVSGAIWFDGQRIDGLAAADVVRRGVAHVPE
ncbi:MAG: ATP-binding cassette domain-containing protein, partial [Alphaproteobacteria bacterium]